MHPGQKPANRAGRKRRCKYNKPFRGLSLASGRIQVPLPFSEKLMSFLISRAEAADAAAGGGGFPVDLLIIAALFIALYMLIFRPQQKRAREHRDLVSGLEKGDEVVASGGFIGRVVEVRDEILVIEIAEGVQVLQQRNAVSAALPKGTIKSVTGNGKKRG